MNNIGRNDPCPCGSNKKYKKCCLIKKDEALKQEREQEDLEWNEWFKADCEEGQRNLTLALIEKARNRNLMVDNTINLMVDNIVDNTIKP